MGGHIRTGYFHLKITIFLESGDTDSLTSAVVCIFQSVSLLLFRDYADPEQYRINADMISFVKASKVLLFLKYLLIRLSTNA